MHLSVSRFRLNDLAHAQRYALNVPYTILEMLAQPRLSGASRLFDQSDIASLPSHQRNQAAAYLGLYLLSDGQGTITGIHMIKQRLACPSQDQHIPAAQQKIATERWAKRQALG